MSRSQASSRMPGRLARTFSIPPHRAVSARSDATRRSEAACGIVIPSRPASSWATATANSAVSRGTTVACLLVASMAWSRAVRSASVDLDNLKARMRAS